MEKLAPLRGVIPPPRPKIIIYLQLHTTTANVVQYTLDDSIHHVWLR